MIIKLNRCLDCGKIIDKRAKRCKSCGCPLLKHGKSSKYKKYYCLNCHKKLSDYRHKRCYKCENKLNPHIKGKTLIKHHIDLNKQNNKKKNILELTSSCHLSLHHRAYRYIVKIGLVKQYIKWFFKQNKY